MGLIAKPDFGFNITKYVKQEIRKQKKKAIPASKYYNQLAYSFHGTKKQRYNHVIQACSGVKVATDVHLNAFAFRKICWFRSNAGTLGQPAPSLAFVSVTAH